MVNYLKNKLSFPKYPEEIRVKVEKLISSPSLAWKAIIRDETGFDTLVNFRGGNDIQEGKCYLFNVTVGKEFRGKCDLVTNLDQRPYSLIDDLNLPDVTETVSQAVTQEGYHYHIRAQVKCIPPKTKTNDNTRYWVIELSDGQTSCNVVFWGAVSDPLPTVTDGEYDIYCLSYIPSTNPQYPIGYFDANAARWVRVTGDQQQELPPQTIIAQSSQVLPSELRSAPPQASSVQCTSTAPSSTSNDVASMMPVKLSVKEAFGIVGDSRVLPADCTTIANYCRDMSDFFTGLRDIFHSAEAYEAMKGKGFFYKDYPASADNLAIIREELVELHSLSSAEITFAIETLRSIQNKRN